MIILDTHNIQERMWTTRHTPPRAWWHLTCWQDAATGQLRSTLGWQSWCEGRL